MNVNVIKQFSVYLKLQTFHPMYARPRGRRRKKKKQHTKITFLRRRWDNAKKKENCFSFPSRSCCFSEKKRRKFPSCYEILCACLYLIFFFFVLNLYFFGCVAYSRREREEKKEATPEEKQRRESWKKWSHNRRNMNKRYLNTNECLKIHKKRKNDILWKHKKASRNIQKRSLKRRSGIFFSFRYILTSGWKGAREEEKNRKRYNIKYKFTVLGARASEGVEWNGTMNV